LFWLEGQGATTLVGMGWISIFIKSQSLRVIFKPGKN
jgi:hypothetical protein